jgi:hypothetical protein
MKLRTLPGNPLFIPETYGEPRGAANAFYTYGEFDGIGICPFGIESLPIYGLGTNDRPENPGELPLARAYEVLRQLSPLIIENMGTDKMRGGALKRVMRLRASPWKIMRCIATNPAGAACLPESLREISSIAWGLSLFL